MVIEKRRFPRADIVCKISTVFAERLLVFNTHTENIGEGGIKVILETRLHILTPVDVELYLAGRSTPIKCKGQVTWANNISPAEAGPSLFDTGITFTELTEENKKEIRKLVNTILVQKS